ncbi:SagB-type dehydrogenase domain-containing protein [Desulfacinum hydrothermale DSM 13146]|uniref:SagB-type dehydrogenase domain-containing protein n=1 Tax=Desulfacinum hydrothermale DSM 13146 TaxID=1121390 RepID=A0A1W1XA34_9BACT|nr:SagB/ThcOx family dehydrogenase [Desulfacinum hydrothermale]SMC20749.1 SagB-type dehydrogenase domain-containing protein [Desulfacinum hydrothermale DSM 13146]
MDRTGFRYQEHTAYSRGHLGGGYLDWTARPSPFKEYRNLPSVDLPGEVSGAGTGFWDVVSQSSDPSRRPMDLTRLGRILHLAYGVTARSGRGRDAHFFRAAPSAGALYPCEIYVAVQSVEGVGDGLYHFDLAHNRLCELRPGVFWKDGKEWAAVFFITALFYRSAWKYRDRAYRYCLLDTGHLLENVVLAAGAEGMGPRVLDPFEDELVNRFLGIDPEREVCLAMVGIPSSQAGAGWERSPIAPGGPSFPDDRTLEPVQPEASRMSPSDRVPPTILQVHRETRDWIEAPEAGPGAAFREISDQPTVDVPRPAHWPDAPAFAQVLWRRRSYRNFVDRGLSAEAFSFLVHGIGSGLDTFSGVSVSFLCAGVEGLDPGSYLWDEAASRAICRKAGDARDQLASACLDQQWLRHAAVLWGFSADLQNLEKRLGPRAYRRALIQAGRLGQRLYLGATALDLGACGIGAYYDHEARYVLGLPEFHHLIYVVATGPVKRLWHL